MAEWHKLNKKSLPPINGPRFLLLRGYREKGGGVLCVARRDEYGIRYVGGEKGWRYLPDEEYRSSVWQPVELPGEGRVICTITSRTAATRHTASCTNSHGCGSCKERKAEP